jgi:ankyrin repeat protein
MFLKSFTTVFIAAVTFFNFLTADIDISESLWFTATRSGCVDLIQECLKTGIDVNSYDNDTKNTALMNAIGSGNIDAVKLLINSGADINAISTTADNTKKCPITMSFRHPNILELLIESGADIQIKLSQKKTPLHYVVDSMNVYNHDEDNFFISLCILLKNGADVNAIDLYKRTPLHLAFLSKRAVIALLENGANIHAIDHEGWKPLHRAYGDIDLLKEFIKRGASLNEFSPDGKNALQSACCHLDNLNLIKFLVEEQGMNINENARWYDGRDGALTAFMLAVGSQKQREDDFTILEYLINKGANLNAQIFTKYDRGIYVMYSSVLSWAISTKQSYYVIEWLRDKGARELPNGYWKN